MISYEENTNKFNFRVGGIIESPDKKKILIHRLSNFDFWLLPGGRVEMLEDTKKAILREIEEELGIKVTIDRLVAITESFFDIKSSTYHELAFKTTYYNYQKIQNYYKKKVNLLVLKEKSIDICG